MVFNNKLKENILIVSAVVFLVTVIVVPLLYLGTVMLTGTSIIEFALNVIPEERMHGKNILLFGIDDTRAVQRADTVMVLHIDSVKKRLGLLSIPRDTRAHVPGHGLTKINHAYAYGGTDLLKDTISSLLGIPLNGYVKINLAGVEKAIDQIGGLTIDIDKDLFYEDKAGGLYIDLKKGRQTLTGRQAIQYIRFRNDDQGDLGRINRQQMFVKSFANKITDSGNIFKLPFFIRTINKNIESDLTLKQMLGLSMDCKESYQKGNIQIGTVPGAVIMYRGICYLRPDIVAMDRLIRDTLFGFEKSEGELITKVETVDTDASKEDRRCLSSKEINRIMVNTDETEIPSVKFGIGLQIEVLNGSGSSGKAKEITSYLRKLGLKVVRFGNAASFDYENTLIVDWKGEVNEAVRFAQILSLDASRIILYDRPEKPLNLTLVIGKDWKDISVFASNELRSSI
ncbi:LCP family protein [Candidatus Margulisiibacteriota bacterium]